MTHQLLGLQIQTKTISYKGRSFYSNKNPEVKFDIFTSNIADTIKECAP